LERYKKAAYVLISRATDPPIHFIVCCKLAKILLRGFIHSIRVGLEQALLNLWPIMMAWPGLLQKNGPTGKTYQVTIIYANDIFIRMEWVCAAHLHTIKLSMKDKLRGTELKTSEG